MNKAALPIITMLTLLGHVASGRRKYVGISSKLQIVFSSNSGSNSHKYTFSLTFLQTDGNLKGG